MKDINLIVENGVINDEQKKIILESFSRRIENLDEQVEALVIVNPDLSKYAGIESISGNSKRYLVDICQIVDLETKIRLASFKLESKDISLLYEFKMKSEAPQSKKSYCSDIHSYFPPYLEKEKQTICDFIQVQANDEHYSYNVFCVSGDCGMGKTHFVNCVAADLSANLWTLHYGDIDAENTSLIEKKKCSFFSKTKAGDIILIENADSFLVGTNLNRFVKNTLISSISERTDLVFFIETSNPAQFEMDIKKLITTYIYIKPISQNDRFRYLDMFLSKMDITITSDIFEKFNTVGLSVRDIKQLAFLSKIEIDRGVDETKALTNCSFMIQESKVNSILSSDSPFIAKKPKYNIDSLILPEDKRETIKYAIALISNTALVYNTWNFAAVDPYPRSIVNFYGKPGTGKTMCAHAIAEYLGKDLLALNYAEIESKYIGDAPKKLESAFAYARQHNTVMFFDEADSFLGKRIEDVSHSADQALNSLRSTMLIQLEMFEGVVIFASNLRENYDKAFKSRFLYEIEFELPNSECRKGMFLSYIRKLLPLKNAEFSEDEIVKFVNLSDGLSGREIKSSVLDALNQLAYLKKFSNDNEAVMESAIMEKCIQSKVDANQTKVKVNTDVQEDKDLIGAKLAEQYAPLSRKNKYASMLAMGYYAAWADGFLAEEELCLLQEAKNDLNIDAPDYSARENLPSFELLVEQIQEEGLAKESIDLCIHIVASDGIYQESEMSFIHSLCKSFKFSDEKIALVDKLSNTIAQEKQITKIL